MRISILIFGISVSFANAAAAVTADDYARAERFLTWNLGSHVLNADIQHHWIENEDRFWYRRTSASGENQFVVVDAASGKRALAFDHGEVARVLAERAGKAIEAGKLPFSRFRYVRDETTIQFVVSGSLWTCRIKPVTCASERYPARSPKEAVSPDGKWAVYVDNHNLWVRAVGSEKGFALTTNGIEHHGYDPASFRMSAVNARIQHPEGLPPDVLWSPDARYLLAYRLDERQVKEMYLLQSVPEDGSARPKLHSYRVPFPGDKHVALLEPVVIEISSRRQVMLNAAPAEAVFPRGMIKARNVWWSADSRELYFLTRDRFAQRVSLDAFSVDTGRIRQLLRETASGSSVRVSDDYYGGVWQLPAIRTLGNGDIIWWSERDGWGHLYYYDGATCKLRNQITRGDWVVSSIVQVDETNRRLYFMARGREAGRDPYKQHLYSVGFDGSEIRLLTPEDGEHTSSSLSEPALGDLPLGAGEVERFSPSGRYFVDSFSSPDLPPVFVLRAAHGALVAQLETADISRLQAGGYVPVEPFQVTAADGKTAIYGNLFRPSSFDPSKKYPIIDSVFPGPWHIRTGKSFRRTLTDYEAQSLAELGFVVISIDGRGTPQRSRAFLSHSYGRLDKASDLDDHIEGIRQLARRYPYLDLERVGVDGVSAGGYAAAHAVLAYPGFYKVAVSAEGAHDPSATWMGVGETYIGALNPSNQENYLAAANQPLAGSLQGKLLIMNGDMDDNTSIHLTMKLVDALIKANKDFDLLIVPNGNHYAFMSPYFIRRKWDYFVRNLLGAETPAGYAIEQPKWVMDELNRKF